jgi:hypothetical protein
LNSVTGPVDLAVKILLYEKFADILGIDDGTGTDSEKINLGVIQHPKEVALRAVAEKRGEDYLEFISFWRVSAPPAWNRQRTVLARRGLWLPNSSGLSGVNVKAQPIDLNYSVWFWSKSLDKVYQCVERYIMWQQNYPKIDLSYDYGNNTFSYSPDLHFGEPVDESTFPTEFNTGVIAVYKVPIKVDAWVLESAGSTASGIVTKIRVTFYDKDDITEYSKIVDEEDSSYDSELASVLKLSRRQLYGVSLFTLSSNSVTVPNNRTADFSIGDVVTIEGSTSNDETYTVLSVALVGGSTKIVLGGNTLVDEVADGTLCLASI